MLLALNMVGHALSWLAGLVEKAQTTWGTFLTWLDTPAGLSFVLVLISALLILWTVLLIYLSTRWKGGLPKVRWHTIRYFFRRRRRKKGNAMTRKERDERERMLIEDGITNLLDDLVYNNKISKETAEGMMKSLGKSGRLPGLLFRHAKKTTPSAFVAKTDIIERRGTAAKVMKQVDGIPFPDAPKPVRKPKNGLEAAFGGVSS